MSDKEATGAQVVQPNQSLVNAVATATLCDTISRSTEYRCPRQAHEIDSHIFEPTVMLGQKLISLARRVRIDSFVKIEGGLGVAIEECCHVASFAHLNIGGGALFVGPHVTIASGVRIVTGSNVEAGYSMSVTSPPEMQVVRRRHVSIHTRAFVGAGAVILPGVTIGEGAIVGAGAVVTQSVAPWTVVMGAPARFVRNRTRNEGQ